MRSRYYSPDLRQFLSADRYMGDLYHPASLNPYSYVEGNPVRYIDPMGYAAVNTMMMDGGSQFRRVSRRSVVALQHKTTFSSSDSLKHSLYDTLPDCVLIQQGRYFERYPVNSRNLDYVYRQAGHVAVLYNIDHYNRALLQKYTGTGQYSLSRSSAQNPFADGMAQEPMMKSVLYNGTLHSVEIYNEERLADVMSRYSEGSGYLYMEGRTWGPIMDGLLMTAVGLGDYGKNAYQQNQIIRKPPRDSNQNLSFEMDLQLFAEDDLKEIYKSIKDSPNYPDGFKAVQNGTSKVRIKNKQVYEKLKKVEKGDWYKVYKNGYDVDGERISIHYFQSSSGKVFDVKIKPHWSE